jgi:hypothetical protein
VYRSKAALSKADAYRRRRQCRECRRTWPTLESTDWDLFEGELAQEGLTLADVGLERPSRENRPTRKG